MPAEARVMRCTCLSAALQQTSSNKTFFKIYSRRNYIPDSALKSYNGIAQAENHANMLPESTISSPKTCKYLCSEALRSQKHVI